MAPPKVNVRAVQLSVEGLFKLLGGSANDRELFWEKLLGITSRREAVLLNTQLASFAASAKQLTEDAKALQAEARQKG
jgi:hypothetical protein